MLSKGALENRCLFRRLLQALGIRIFCILYLRITKGETVRYVCMCVVGEGDKEGGRRVCVNNKGRHIVFITNAIYVGNF